MNLKEYFKQKLINSLSEQKEPYSQIINPFRKVKIYKPIEPAKIPGEDNLISKMSPEKAKSLIGVAPGFEKTPSKNTLAARKKNTNIT